jgi:mycothiol synthase
VTIPPLTRVASADFPSIVDTVKKIEDATEGGGRHPTLGEAVWRDLERPDNDSAAFLVDSEAFAHVARSDNGVPRHWAVGLAVTTGSREPDTVLRLLIAVDDHVAAHGGGRLTLWIVDAQPEDDGVLAAAGYAADRELYEMRVPLPLGEEPVWPPRVTTRSFEPGRDDAAWLAVNNRAFAGHAEQGGWTEATLQRRFADAWFDPKLFLLAFDDAGLAGFNWLKIHAAHRAEPRRGEIFVIGVDPRMQGTGLGRALAVAGLDLVHQQAVDTGMLFCAADNAPALKLYRSLGFTIHRLDRAYVRDVSDRAGGS